MLAKEVFFTGENGQGKSNLLEALYFSAYGSSFRTHNDAELLRRGNEAAGMSVRAMYKGGGEEASHTTFITMENGRKKIERDGKSIKDRKELIYAMPCVLYNHDDLDFAEGSPERRRFFIDQTLSMYDLLYIDIMRKFRRILKSRNLCLKEKNYSLLDTYDVQLVQEGLEIQRRRKTALFKFNQIFGRLYEQVSGLDGVGISYLPSWKAEGVEQVLAHLKERRAVDQTMGTTMSGPHRDRIAFVRNGAPFVPVASMGQRRLIALVLRTAQAVYFTEETRRKPVLLMDDVLLELDSSKREKMTALLPDYDQLFCTFLPGEPWERYIHKETKVYEISGGCWNESAASRG